MLPKREQYKCLRGGGKRFHNVRELKGSHVGEPAGSDLGEFKLDPVWESQKVPMCVSLKVPVWGSQKVLIWVSLKVPVWGSQKVPMCVSLKVPVWGSQKVPTWVSLKVPFGGVKMFRRGGGKRFQSLPSPPCGKPKMVPMH